jgi:GrpB-like predicted nucleotidyltransferase (UPF0157 family)
MAAEAPVEIVPYDASWPAAFESEASLLRRALAPWLTGPLEHIGSTAVPGLAAKPVIDIMAAVRSLEDSRPAIDAAAGIGYSYAPYRPESEHWFCKPSPQFRTHHLHLVPTGAVEWVRCLAFRDYLRERPQLAVEYEALKRRLAREHQFDREAYTEAKRPFIDRVTDSALKMGYGAPATSILWRRLDQPGHDSARLIELAAGPLVEGTAVFSESGQACRLDYRVVCDPRWRTLAARVSGWLGMTPVEVEIAADAARSWTLNGRPCPAVEGCDDLDLSFTPATNLLPIRRLSLAIDARAAVRSAWLGFPSLTLEPLNQTYHRTADTRYAYESRGGSFSGVLHTNGVGFVTEYPTLWKAETAS